jgi:hypothetical protein
MRRYDSEWIIIYSEWIIHLGALLAKKLEKISCRAHFSGKSQFGDLRSITFQSHFEASNNMFWGQNFVRIATSPSRLFHTETFPMVQKSPQLKLVYESYASHKLTHLVDHHGTEWVPHQPPLLTHVGLVTWDFQEYSRRCKTLTNQWLRMQKP